LTDFFGQNAIGCSARLHSAALSPINNKIHRAEEMALSLLSFSSFFAMRTFYCETCNSLVFFENSRCIKCGHALGFLPEPGELSALEPAGNDAWRPLAAGQNQLYRLCDNARRHQICNWMIPVNDPNPFCVSCRLTTLVPDLTVPGNVERWHKVEKAKRRLIYTIMRLGLPTEAAPQENRPALRFHFVADIPGAPPPLTGHSNGLIVLNIAEADDAERERRRVNLHEPYRTLLGHFRHEIGHYYWDRLIARSPRLERFRKLFGDENAPYDEALKRYYQQGAPPDWQPSHVSAYATAHPWEDWAETWAHYFHIIDMVETAASFGVTLHPRHPAAGTMTADLPRAAAVNPSFDCLLHEWFPLTYALNSLNRGMGLADIYPFALSTPAIEKLRFIHDVARRQ
jgi:hypothetical protein